MADMIQCPMCGTENPSTQKVCQRCQTPLSIDASFQPGQAPSQKDTGELEAILPQWLRDARASAKVETPIEQPKPKDEEKPKAPPAPSQPASSMDFLASLQSQAADEEEEEVPDWLASITGATAPKQKPEETETGGVRWVETGRKDDFQQSGSSDEEEVPSWLAGIQTPQFGAEDKDELTDWFRESGGEQQAPQQPVQQTPAFSSPFSTPASSSNDTPDWLRQMAANAGELEPEAPVDSSFDSSSDWFSDIKSDSNAVPQEKSSDTPDWLKQMQADANVAPQEKASEPFNLPSDTPDWLSQMQADANVAPQEKAPEPFNLPSETPDWLSQMQADANVAPQEKAPEPFNLPSDTPDWLNSLGGESAPFVESTPAESEPFISGGDVPAWLASDEQQASKKIDSTPVWLQGEGDVDQGRPAWLASNDATLVTPPENTEPVQNDPFGDMPDWLKAAAPQTSIFDDASQVAEPLKAETPKPQTSSPFESAPAFSEDAFGSEGGDALFTEMPDWLSNAMESPAPSSIVPEPITGSDALAPNALPSWVEAMRPSDQGMANIVAASKDQTLESRGALAGLSGVLPVGVGFAPTSKPKAYSIKLNASEEQLKHAAILEQILAAETAPESLATERSLAASRGLRWALAFILLVVAFVTVFMRTQIFSMPVGIPNELSYAVAVAQAIPENSPVLVAVDYEPSRAGEMEAAAAPLFDNMLLLKHPRLTFVSSNETGAILAERFMAGPLATHNYQTEVTYLNLGYLSGGQMGIRAFAQNPSVAAPLDIYGQPAWTFAPLEGVTAFDQFAVIILITDNANAARTWVEQTEDARGVVPVIVVSSAQAAPMIQPYYDSGQVDGMVSGLYGGALFERHYNSGRPGTARAYWDAFSIAMLLAMVLVLGGGLFNLALGLRERAAVRGEK